MKRTRTHLTFFTGHHLVPRTSSRPQPWQRALPGNFVRDRLQHAAADQPAADQPPADRATTQNRQPARRPAVTPEMVRHARRLPDDGAARAQVAADRGVALSTCDSSLTTAPPTTPSDPRPPARAAHPRQAATRAADARHRRQRPRDLRRHCRGLRHHRPGAQGGARSTTSAAPAWQVLSTALTAHIDRHRPPTSGRHSTHPRPTPIPTLLPSSCPAWSVVRW